MATSLGIITILGLAANWIMEKLRLPGLLGMLLVGIMMGPSGLDLMSPELMRVSADFREIALIIILLRAGLGLDWDVLKKVGRPALGLSFIPGVLEGATVMLVSTVLFDFSLIQGGIMGFIIAAVSPAVVVPAMLQMKDERRGEDKNIPTLILAGASLDDIVAITIFTSFLGLYGGKDINLGFQMMTIPISILTGIGVGFVVGLVFVRIFETHHIRDTKKVLMILGAAIVLMGFEDLIKETVPFSGFLGVMTIGFAILLKRGIVAKRLSVKFNKIWILAEILLFVLVGAQVDLGVTLNAGGVGIIIIAAGLLLRSLGVYIALLGTDLNSKEKLFCAVAYTPKATVQAAIGAVPLAYGVQGGDVILSMAVLSIVLTAPLGAVGIRYMKRYLSTLTD
ncbi:cation:proton antiporter [Gudongella sp. SC589]|uniref:cation:proton antiporter n=1 Tax=Gudongella sp. SC589 TaxID=3385990 RepID=UPI003904B7C4